MSSFVEQKVLSDLMFMVHSSAQSSPTQNSMDEDIALNTHGLWRSKPFR